MSLTLTGEIRRGLALAGLLVPAAPCCAQKPSPPPQGKTPPPLSARVVEMGQVVDLTRGGRHWLVATVEVSAPGGDGSGLRHVQPLREHFTLEDESGGRLECAWLKGGSAPEDPAVLRFRAGFPMPGAAARKVALTVLLPQPKPPQPVEIQASQAELSPLPARIDSPPGTITVRAIEERAYAPPALPEAGRYAEKGGAADLRVFLRPLRAGEKPPERALRVSWESSDVALFDRAVDLDGSVQGVDGKRYPLLSAVLTRIPSRAIRDPDRPPRLVAEYWFRTPPKGLVAGLSLTFQRRADTKEHAPVRIENLPIPGRG